MGEGIQVDVHIHAIEAGDDGGYHQRDAEARHAFHDSIDVVGNNGGKSIHRSRENVTVNIHRVKCLFQFDNHIFH